MRTLILSDLFLGEGGGPSGGAALRDLLLRVAGPGVRVIFTGNTFDFLSTDDPIEIVPPVAAARASALVAVPETAAALRALGELLARGGEAVMRLGATDVELFLPAVQAVVRGALGQPPAVARRLSFLYGDTPVPLEAGGAHIVAAHGEHMDEASRVDYFRLPGPDGSPPLKGGAFRRPDGMVLYKQLLGPLRRTYGMQFVDFLRPWYRAAAVAAMAIDTAAIKHIVKTLSMSFLGDLLAGRKIAMAFSDTSEDLTLAQIGQNAHLDEAEADALRDLFDRPETPAGAGMVESFADDDAGWLVRKAVNKLATAALRHIARLQRAISGDGGWSPSLDPDESEMVEADRLASKFQASVVILGHTGLARWQQDPELLYVNTGTWAYQLAVPPAKSKDAAWQEFFDKLKADPSGAPVRAQRRTCVTVEPSPGEGALGGAVVRLCEVAPDGALSTLEEAHVPPTRLH